MSRNAVRDAQIRMAHRAGVAVYRIATHHGLSRERVRQILAASGDYTFGARRFTGGRHGRPPRPVVAPDGTVIAGSVTEAARRLRCSVMTLYRLEAGGDARDATLQLARLPRGRTV